MNYNKLAKSLLFALAVQIAASATTISFVAVDGVSDGRYSVSPFAIQIEGKSYRAMCYDLLNHVSVGQVWQANLLTINDLGGAYYFNRPDSDDLYRKAGWYYTELLKVLDPASRIGIQHAAWLLFDPSASKTGAAPWQAAAMAAAQSGYPSVDFSTLRFIESATGRTRVQGLVVGGFPSSVGETPELATWVTVLVGGGMLVFGRRTRAAGPPNGLRRT